jgi:hypothetical protein
LTLLGVTHASVGDEELFKSAQPDNVDLGTSPTPASLRELPVRGPVPNLGATIDAPSHKIEWCIRPLATGRADGPAAATPVRITRLAKAALERRDDPDTVVAATNAGTLFALNVDGTTRWTIDTGTVLNDVVADDFTLDGKDEIVLARNDYHVQMLDATGKELWKRSLAYYRKPPYVNLVRTGDLDGDGVPEVIAGGENWRFYAFKADGTELWNYESVHPSRSGTVADLDGDGKAEVICGTHYYWASVLNADGGRRWQYRFGPVCYDIATGQFGHSKTRGVIFGGGDGKIHYLDADGKPRMTYTAGDEVKHVATGDLDGDGLDEILAGSLNYNVYCFGPHGERRWRLDLGGPVSALVSVPHEEGALVVVGTAKGRLATVDSNGNITAVSEFESEILDILAGHQSVFVATADGQLRRLAALSDEHN